MSRKGSSSDMAASEQGRKQAREGPLDAGRSRDRKLMELLYRSGNFWTGHGWEAAPPQQTLSWQCRTDPACGYTVAQIFRPWRMTVASIVYRLQHPRALQSTIIVSVSTLSRHLRWPHQLPVRASPSTAAPRAALSHLDRFQSTASRLLIRHGYPPSSPSRPAGRLAVCAV